MILTLRLKLLRLLIGKLSVIANISTDGNVLLGSGMVINSLFSDKLLSRSGIVYSSRINLMRDSSGVIDNNVIMGNRP